MGEDFAVGGEFETINNTKVFTRLWNSELSDGDTPRALVYICHGFGEHTVWYGDIAKKFNKAGILMAGHDYVGHGKSEGRRFYSKDLNEHVQNVISHLSTLKTEYPGIPFFLLGYSMGGWVAIKLALEKPDLIKGLVVIGPMIITNPEIGTPFKIFLARTLAKVWPTCPVGKFDSTYMCRDPEIRRIHQEDKLTFHGYVTAGMGVAALNAMDELEQRMSELKLPILAIHGSDDKVCVAEGSKILISRVQSTDKTLSIYKDCYHKVFREPDGEGERCIKEVYDWILTRI